MTATRLGQMRAARARNDTGDSGTWLAGVRSRFCSNIDICILPVRKRDPAAKLWQSRFVANRGETVPAGRLRTGPDDRPGGRIVDRDGLAGHGLRRFAAGPACRTRGREIPWRDEARDTAR